MVIGVRRSGAGALEAHAWLACDGRDPLLEPSDSISTFRPLGRALAPSAESGSRRRSAAIFRLPLLRREHGRLQQLHDAGQSIWLDFIDRTILRNGDLARRIEEDALTGMTSNPTIFEGARQACARTTISSRARRGERCAWELFELVRNGR